MFMKQADNRLTPPERADKMPCSRLTVAADSPSREARGVVRGGREYKGGVAQLGERVNGIHEVRGSIPLASMQEAGR